MYITKDKESVPRLDKAKNEQVTIWGSSNETKPTKYANGSVWIDTDTQKVYIYDAKNSVWREW